jgi:BirA family biotin operon repressor/biotin-[acetyl-CoA-carboxylase] ligase
VNQASFAPDLEPIATSLRLAGGHEWSRVQVAAALLESLDAWYRRLSIGGVAARRAIFQQFEQRSSFARSRLVHVDEEGGYDGVTEGLDSRGFLLVRTDGGLRTVLSGGVRAVASHGS